CSRNVSSHPFNPFMNLVRPPDIRSTFAKCSLGLVAEAAGEAKRCSYRRDLPCVGGAYIARLHLSRGKSRPASPQHRAERRGCEGCFKEGGWMLLLAVRR